MLKINPKLENLQTFKKAAPFESERADCTFHLLIVTMETNKQSPAVCVMLTNATKHFFESLRIE